MVIKKGGEGSVLRENELLEFTKEFIKGMYK